MPSPKSPANFQSLTNKRQTTNYSKTTVIDGLLKTALTYDTVLP